MSLPMQKGISALFFLTFPIGEINLSGLNSCGLSQCRESMCTAYRFVNTVVPLGMSYPAKTVSAIAQCITPKGPVLAVSFKIKRTFYCYFFERWRREQTDAIIFKKMFFETTWLRDFLLFAKFKLRTLML